MRKNLKTGCSNLSAIAFLLTVFIALPVYGEEATNLSKDWEIRFMPYAWIPTLSAKSTINGVTGNVKLNPWDVIDNLDFAMMGRMEIWKNKWGFSFDGVYMNLGASKSFRGRRDSVVFNLDADVRLGMSDFGVMYRLFEKSFGKNNQQKLTLEPYGGLRYGYLTQKAHLNVNLPGVGSIGRSFGTKEEWVEPFVGGRLTWDLNEKIAFNVRSDAGGFGIGRASDLTWQVVGGMDYKFSKNIVLNAGYRYVDLDYSHGSGSDEFGIHLKAYGPFIGLTIVF